MGIQCTDTGLITVSHCIFDGVIPVLTSQESRALDSACEDEGMPASMLMETASVNAVTSCPLFTTPTTILVVCGNGNNGGDGYAMARLLQERHQVSIAARPAPSAMTPETRENLHRARALGISIVDPDDIADQTVEVIVDAIIGVGGGAGLRDPVPQWTRAINAHPARIVAVDVPTGLDATTGEAHPDAVCASVTMTMEALKPGLLTVNGRKLCGQVNVVSIGAPHGLAASRTTTFALDHADITRLLPPREPGAHKFTLGHVVVIAGSRGMRGAAALAAEAALRTGAGLVTLVSDAVHPLLPREVMTAELDQAVELANRASVIIAGPGFGREPARLQLLADALNAVPATPVVLDADGLRALPLLQRPMSNVVVTPHAGEFRAMLETAGVRVPSEIDSHAAREAARAFGCIVHLKCIPPTSTDIRRTYLCTSGNASLATAGSGDVLSGIIGGLIAQHVAPLEAAALGAYLHGAAAESITAHTAVESLIAGDIIRELGSVMAE